MYQTLLLSIEEERAKLREIIVDKSDTFSSFKSDNYDPSFHHICNMQGMIEGKLLGLEVIRDKVQVVAIEDQSELLKIGNRAVISYDNGKKEDISFTLEGDIIPSKYPDEEYLPISVNSPIGKKVQGLKVGDKTSLDLGGKSITLTVTSILPPLR